VSRGMNRKARYTVGPNRPGGGGHAATWPNYRAAVDEALDPTKAPSKPKTFAEMTEAERAEMRRLYERKP